MIAHFFIKYRSLLCYGISLAILLLFMQWLEWRLLIIGKTFELYAVAIAILFTALGIWLAGKLTRPRIKTLVVERQVVLRSDEFVLNEEEIARLHLSKRELEVLQLMAEGLSNQQMAEKLFVSLNTIKTHCSNLFFKLQVQRRAQAIQTGRKLNIIR